MLANDIDAGAAPTLYCITEPIPPGSYVGIDSRFGLKGGPTLDGRTANACDYEDAARLWEFAERETGTTLSCLRIRLWLPPNRCGDAPGVATQGCLFCSLFRQ